MVSSAAPSIFTAGLDLAEGLNLGASGPDHARVAMSLAAHVKHIQQSFTAIEECCKPVIAAVHGPCVGGGVDMITACDVRLCAEDSWFQVKEVEVGLAADVGTLQRLPKIVGNDSIVRELCLTGRKLYAAEALRLGMVSHVCKDRAETVAKAIELAAVMASHSPVAVAGTKKNLNFSRDHTIAEGLEHVANWNAFALQSVDVMTAVKAQMKRQKPTFLNLYGWGKSKL